MWGLQTRFGTCLPPPKGDNQIAEMLDDFE
jgi:hypothetical protein